MNRRVFLAGAAWACVAGQTIGQTAKLRGAVIGHTGKGNYGHGLDAALANRDDIELPDRQRRRFVLIHHPVCRRG